MNVRFYCPNCDYPARVPLPETSFWECPACDHRLAIDRDVTKDNLSPCAICGNHELYKKKDFPHALGMGILIVACILSFITYAYYEKWLTWAILIGTALFDGILFLLVGDVVVCYRCQAHYRGIPKGTTYPPYELAIAERYRQERLRKLKK